MKIYTKNSFLVLVLFTLFLESCTSEFESMNVSPNSATTVPATNILGKALLNSSQILFGERLDAYYTASYAGYNAPIGGDYEYRVGINNSQWDAMYASMTYAVEAMNVANTEENTNLYAAALTLKSYMAHKTSDIWGAIPYSEAFNLKEEQTIYPKYDTEPEIYAQILAELKTAADLFDTNGDDIGEGDFLYNGDVAKWRKFCNSLRLRIAIRMSSADEATAKTVIASIVNNPSAYPVFETNNDNAYFWWPGVVPDVEPWFATMGATDGNKIHGYRVNKTLVNTLQDNDDPRLPVYADKNKYGVYHGYEFGPNQLNDTLNNGNNVSHIGDRFGNNPAGFSPFMNTAEVYFLLAEAYERNLISGDLAQDNYETGLTMSLEENEIATEDITTFLAQDEIAWDSGSSDNLYKIRIQKWISLYKQSVEGWAEARRTDVPLIQEVSRDYSASHNRPPFRFPYPDSEKSLNTNFPTDVVEKDIFYGTQMWWDKRTGVQ
ncbi:SusD/RagB family nutrient-binding outer membrane lipoprotein [Formosa sp. 3Alg 14/1]|uniref:SusD/RagB family nutrient-binding outer membrane lipoprotein n=1 Tax=Formosa sp. 3Alg 14/1 TaxID=3382190 RepID=UPI0039BDB9B7